MPVPIAYRTPGHIDVEDLDKYGVRRLTSADWGHLPLFVRKRLGREIGKINSRHRTRVRKKLMSKLVNGNDGYAKEAHLFGSILALLNDPDKYRESLPSFSVKCPVTVVSGNLPSYYGDNTRIHRFRIGYGAGVEAVKLVRGNEVTWVTDSCGDRSGIAAVRVGADAILAARGDKLFVNTFYESGRYNRSVTSEFNTFIDKHGHFPTDKNGEIVDKRIGWAEMDAEVPASDGLAIPTNDGLAILPLPEMLYSTLPLPEMLYSTAAIALANKLLTDLTFMQMQYERSTKLREQFRLSIESVLKNYELAMERFSALSAHQNYGMLLMRVEAGTDLKKVKEVNSGAEAVLRMMEAT